ncbi:hypothetical protein BJG89_10525 [Staphylococcus nepalensis]|uniref:hypothetical protein n=1 Tax=Staphylococcus TaxID=1279 RepID=UPI000BC2E6BA|nr:MULTISPECIES: hypothetical protein [Staphylococcus]ATH65731.1 hypothetical protein BJG89_10525 [Staphylococcus nepalensis]AWI44815.1 hypothetical protein BJG88_08720 [Staphylococcus nepalensis]NWN86869.1 hypothetical protein [Staphylococcus sp.]
MESVMVTMLRQDIPTGYDKQINFYKKNLEKLLVNPFNENVLNKLIGTLILMCHDQTSKDLNSLIDVYIEEENTIQDEVNGLGYAINYLMDLNSFNEEQQSKRILYNYLILLNIAKMQKGVV